MPGGTRARRGQSLPTFCYAIYSLAMGPPRRG